MDIMRENGFFNIYDTPATLNFTDEKQLDRIIMGPDIPIFQNESLGYSTELKNQNTEDTTLESFCRDAAARGCARVDVSYDFFFGGTQRQNYPSDITTIKAFRMIHKVAAKYGLKFSASVVSPLDVGGGWIKQSEETGFTYQYCETDIKPDGSYCAAMRCQVQWYNNKGPIQLIPHHIEVYAFREEQIGKTPYFYVDEDAIVPITQTAEYEIGREQSVTTGSGYGYCPMRIFGRWKTPTADRALCIMVYRTPELDYFAPSAPSFMKEILDQHNKAGIRYGGFYSDEMHIQFDWDMSEHFGETEINTRYLTGHLAQEYARLYGEKYRDFAKYLIYMSYHQHDFLPGEEGRCNAQHVLGKTSQAIAATWLLRNRYFELLQRRVVDLANDARSYAETLWGEPVVTIAHATWQESPTCDRFVKAKEKPGGIDVEALLPAELKAVNEQFTPQLRAERYRAIARIKEEQGISTYEYTPRFDWSSSIRENMAACYDYFKWNEFLTGGGTDHAEGGFLDRNYYSHALAASFGLLNDFGIAYTCCWGAPGRVHEIFGNVTNTYGNAFSYGARSFVNGFGVRNTDVLALYPIKLNNAEERFGSWMVQYGYCNYITEEKLLDNAKLTHDGKLEIKGQKYSCVVAMFEPFVSDQTIELLEKFVAAGGKLLWMSVPAQLNEKGEDIFLRFGKLFGLAGVTRSGEEEYHQGEAVTFSGRFSGIKDMTILNDYLVDAVYPVYPEDAEVVATVGDRVIGTKKTYAAGGLAVYMGCRLRDDQSCSLGEDVDTLFRVLCAMGAYRPASPEVRSRCSGAKLIYNTFEDGSVACASHYRLVREGWETRFFRNEELDAETLKITQLPDTHISLHGQMEGHNIDFEGDGFFAYNLSEQGSPKAMYGINTDGMAVDGVKYTFADRPADFEFGEVPAQFLENGINRAILTSCRTPGAILTVPVPGEGPVQGYVCGKRLYHPEKQLAFRRMPGAIRFTVTGELVGKSIFILF